MGGIERASVNTANGLSDTGDCEVLFVSLFKRDRFFKLNDEIRFFEPEGFNISSLSLVKSVLWLRKLIKSEKPDRVLAFNKFYAAISAISLIGIKIPFYISERSSPLYVWIQPFKIINRIAFSLRKPKGVIAQTKIAYDYQKKYFKDSKIKVIPNSLKELNDFPDTERKKIILAVGRLGDSLKGFDRLIEAFAKLKNQSWTLQIAGGDEDGEYLKKTAKELKIIDRIQFLGKVKNIDQLYAEAGIFVIPSRSEGFPNALAEAMAYGCPCIAFDFTAGPRDLIKDGISGLIVEDGNIEKLAETIDELINDTKKRKSLGNHATEIKERLNNKKIIGEIKSFLEI